MSGSGQGGKLLWSRISLRNVLSIHSNLSMNLRFETDTEHDYYERFETIEVLDQSVERNRPRPQSHSSASMAAICLSETR